MRRLPLPPWTWRWLERLERASPATVIIGLFFIAYECMISFHSTRRLLKMARDIAQAVGLV